MATIDIRELGENVDRVKFADDLDVSFDERWVRITDRASTESFLVDKSDLGNLIKALQYVQQYTAKG